MITVVLVRFAYLAVTHAFAVLRLLPMTDRDKDVEILALRHQITVNRIRTWLNALTCGLVGPSGRA